MSDTLVAGVALVVLGGLVRWLSWSATRRVSQIIEPLAADLREHMANEERALVEIRGQFNFNQLEHAEFRHRLEHIEERRSR